MILKKVFGFLLIAVVLYVLFIQISMAVIEKTTWPFLEIVMFVIVIGIEIALLVIGVRLLIK